MFSQDEALLRPGRVDRALYCHAPDEKERYEILKICCKHIPHNEEDLLRIASETDSYSGAELAALRLPGRSCHKGLSTRRWRRA